MEPRRKAAANVFMEQNIAQLASDEEESNGNQANLGQSAEAYAPRSRLDVDVPARQRRDRKPLPSVMPEGMKTSEELQLEKEPIRVRETGIWPLKRVIVPPNVYVVHTRIGRKEPVTLGLGLSFRYNPYTDAYLVVPAAMQTIGIVANSITREKQGINILAYVQWQISDFSVAYKKLDFSDQRDPLGVVNAQLREQAEAAIKDKIATMSVEEVLTDKEPIIEELTARLKAVAEGRITGNEAIDEGLGIKIVTVQIKEALVSSQRLWENLQAPFRYNQEKTARISFLLAQDEIRQKELQNRRLAETGEAETLVEIERIKQSKQTEALQIRLTEESARFTQEQETIRRKIQLEEETTLIRQESEHRVQQQESRVRQEATLAALRRSQEQALEQARLDTESSVRQKALQVEQALQELAEELRLDERQVQASHQRLEREAVLKAQESTFKLAVQEQDDLLRSQIQAALLDRQRQEERTRLELQEEAGKLRLALAEREVAIARQQQEVRNQVSEHDLASRLIERLPELASHTPDIHELTVLQTGNGDGALDIVPAFLAKILVIAERMGLSLKPKQEQDRQENGGLH